MQQTQVHLSCQNAALAAWRLLSRTTCSRGYRGCTRPTAAGASQHAAQAGQL